jgi:hypothetical protein
MGGGEVEGVKDYNLLAGDEGSVTWASWSVKHALINLSLVKRYNSVLLNKLVVSLLYFNIIVIAIEETNTEHIRPNSWPKHDQQWDDNEKIVVLLDNLFPGIKFQVWVWAACWLYCGDQTIDNYLESEVKSGNNNELVDHFNFQVYWGHQWFDVVLINLLLLVLQQSSCLNRIFHDD